MEMLARPTATARPGHPLPGAGTPLRTGSPRARAWSATARDARSASAAIVSDGFTVSEVGTALPSVTKMPR